MEPRLSIVTPWLDRPQFIKDYERATGEPGVQVIVVDNGSSRDNASALRAMSARLGGVYIRNERNRWFSGANNQGLAKARGRIVLFLNNDIWAHSGWTSTVIADVTPDGLYGPARIQKRVGEKSIEYLEGWCIAGERNLWQRLGGWDEKAYAMPYFEDLDLSLRASAMGIALKQVNWPVFHKKNGTCVDVPGVPLAFERNRRTFEARLHARAIPLSPVIDQAPTLQSASALLRDKRIAEAESALAKLVEMQPQNADVWTHYSQALYLSGRAEAAVDAMNKAVELAPNAQQSLNGLGVLLARLGRHGEAVAAFQRAASLAPGAAEVQNNLARSLAQLGRFEESAQAALRAVALAPSSAPAHINLSAALRELGQLPQSLAIAQQACALDPSSALAIANLAQTLHTAGHQSEAVAAIEEALRRTPDNATFQRIYLSMTTLPNSGAKET